jgi:hypothetical protein
MVDKTISPLTLREAVELLKDPLEVAFSDCMAALEMRICRIESMLIDMTKTQSSSMPALGACRQTPDTFAQG